MQLLQTLFRQRPSDFKPLADNRRSDQFVRRHISKEFIVGGLVKQYLIVKLVPDFSL